MDTTHTIVNKDITTTHGAAGAAPTDDADDEVGDFLAPYAAPTDDADDEVGDFLAHERINDLANKEELSDDNKENAEGVNDLANEEEHPDTNEENENGYCNINNRDEASSNGKREEGRDKDGSSSELPEPDTYTGRPCQLEPPPKSPDDLFKPYFNVVDSIDAPFIFAENPNSWDAYKIKSLIEQSHEAMSKFSVKMKVFQILSREDFKEITENIIGVLDWTTKVDPYLLTFCHRSPTHTVQLKKLQEIEKIEDKTKRQEAKIEIKRFDESILSFLDILAIQRHILTHYSQQKDLGKLRKVLGGNTYPDNVVNYFQQRFPGFVLHLLVIFKMAYPSEERLRDVVQF